MTIKTRYFRIATETGYVGERNDYYVAIVMKEDEEPTCNLDFCKAIDDCVFENAMDWYDESEVSETFDEYLEECTAEFEEISVQEYEENTAEWLYEAQLHSFEHQ